MPSPEDLAESQPEPAAYVPAHGRPPEAPRAGFEDAVWFRIDFGRNKHAEARWLLPMICRRGHVTKREIGAIRIYERETRFQIIAEAADGFTALATKGDSDGGRIVRLEANEPTPHDERPPRSRSKPFVKREGAPAGDKPDYAKPKFDKPKFDGPKFEKPKYDKPKFDKPKFDGPKPAKRPWAPPLEGAPSDGPFKPKKAKGPKKRKPNG
jgi:ATP-dependent RNA helicase DeaD